MDVKPIAAALAAGVLLAIHLSSKPAADAVVDTKIPPTTVGTAPVRMTPEEGAALDAEKREAFKAQFRKGFLDTSGEAAQKELYRQMALQGRNPVEVTGPLFGLGDMQVMSSEADVQRFLDEGGVVAGPTSLRPSQLEGAADDAEVEPPSAGGRDGGGR